MVTATTGNIIFKGVKSGLDYSYSVYISDVVGAFATFSAMGPAGTASSNWVSIPAGEDVMLWDISTLLAPTVAVTIMPVVNDRPSGVLIQDANTLFSNTTRAVPKIRIRAGAKFQLIQN